LATNWDAERWDDLEIRRGQFHESKSKQGFTALTLLRATRVLMSGVSRF
jgi:hypothetical protein